MRRVADMTVLELVLLVAVIALVLRCEGAW
jgi:hypothetical protein